MPELDAELIIATLLDKDDEDASAIPDEIAAPDAVRLVTADGDPLSIKSLAQIKSAWNDFLFIGRGLTADEFTDYVNAYDFGTIPPDYVVLHHTGDPCTRQAPLAGATVWDAGEDGRSEEEIYRRRKAKLNNVATFYRNKKWSRGPHLFIDDRYIWLFSPMRLRGNHALEGGNEFTDKTGKYHYSIGIEVVGCYSKVKWPPAIERMVGHAVAALRKRPGTFELEYRAGAKKHTPEGRVGSVCSHRDFNKPSCPGDAIKEDYYISVLRREWQRFVGGTPAGEGGKRLTTASRVVGDATGTRESVERYVRAHLPPGSEYAGDVGVIVGHYWTHAPAVGVDPFLAAAHMVLETESLASPWAARPRRNPASLGVSQEGGLSFDSWERGVQAHLGQLLALALRDDQASAAQRAMMQRNPRHGAIAAALRGTAATVGTLGAGWGGGEAYGQRLLGLAAQMG